MANFLPRNAERPRSSTRRFIYFLLVLLCISNFLVRAQEREETAACKDKKRKVIKIKGQKKMFCKWVGIDPDKRCTNIKVKTKTKKSKRTGRMKKKTVIFNPKELCGCTCADYELEENDNVDSEDRPPQDSSSDDTDNTIDTKKKCPIGLQSNFRTSDASRSSIKSNQLFKQSCLRDGYKKDQECAYEHAWIGCRYGDLSCNPTVVCRCADELVTGDEDTWSCKFISFKECEAKPRPNPNGTSPPYYVPEEAGNKCKPGDDVPQAPDGFITEPPTLEIRRNLRQ